MLKTIENFLSLLTEAKIKFCIIGGIAVLLHGGRASTIDFDFYVLASELKKLVKLLEKNKILFQWAGQYQIKAKFNGISIDVLIADEAISRATIRRAKKIKFLLQKAPVATPEDLIVLKTLADRTIDRRDVEELREIFKGKLDEKYIARQIKKI